MGTGTSTGISGSGSRAPTETNQTTAPDNHESKPEPASPSNPIPASLTTDVLPDLEDPHVLQELENAAVAAADAKMNLIDQLSGAPLTPENIASWLKVIEGLEPGPYSQYLLSKIGDAATTEGPVRNELLSIQESWQTKCGDKQFYEADLTRLANALQPRNSNSLIKSVLNFLQLHNPFR